MAERSSDKPLLAITMGDPAGVGPEIIVRACERLLPRLQAGDLRLLVIGSNVALHAAQRLLGAGIAIPEVAEDDDWDKSDGQDDDDLDVTVVSECIRVSAAVCQSVHYQEYKYTNDHICEQCVCGTAS